MKYPPTSVLLLLLAVGTSSCAGNAEDGRTITSPIPGKATESVAIRVFNSGLQAERQVIVVTGLNSFSGKPNVLHYENPDLHGDLDKKLLQAFSFEWQTPDSVIIRSTYVGELFFIVSKNKLGVIGSAPFIR